VTDELFRYIRSAVAEAGGKNRKEAIENALAFMDAHSKGRKRKAAARYEIVRVRRLGPTWWAVSFRPKRRMILHRLDARVRELEGGK
jgi:hypothetical protein